MSKNSRDCVHASGVGLDTGAFMTFIEEFFVLNRAAIYDIASIFGILGFLLIFASVRYGSKFLAAACGWMCGLAIIFGACNWAAESHYESVQAELRKGASPYYLAGYYAAK